MNILVENGNFANVTIGERLSIPAALTAAVSAYATLTKAQKIALIALYNTLNNAGLWSRLTKLYLPIIAPSLALTHVNVLTGEVDWTPTAQFQLTDEGLTEVGDGPTYTGSTINLGETHTLADITSFAYMSKALISGNKLTYGLNLANSEDRSMLIYGQYMPDVNMWIKASSMTIRTGITDSSSGDFTLLAAVVDSNYASVHKAGFGQWFTDTNDQEVTYDRIIPYANNGAVGLGGKLQISGLMDAITQSEYNTMLSAFNTFSAAVS